MNKRILRARLFLPVSVFALLAGFFLVELGIHRSQLSHRQGLLKALPNPAHTKSIFTHRDFGVVFGGGNHGDYLALQVMETALSRKQIVAFYKDHLGKGDMELTWLKPNGEVEMTPRLGSEGTTLQAYPATFHVLRGWKRRRSTLDPAKRYFVLSNSCSYCFVVDSGVFSM